MSGNFFALFKRPKSLTKAVEDRPGMNSALFKVTITPEIASQIYLAIDKTQKTHLIQKLSNHPLPSKFSTALDLLNIKYDCINLNSPSGHFVIMNKINLRRLETTLGKSCTHQPIEIKENVCRHG